MGKIDAENAAEVGLVAMLGVEGSVQFGIAMLNSLFDFADLGSLSAEIDCISGLITVTLTDNDGGGTISAGDSLQMDFVSCHLGILGLPLSGRVIVDVSSLIIHPDLSVSGQLTFSYPQPLQFQEQGGITLSVTGAQAVSFTGSDAIENLRIETLPNDHFQVQVQGGGDSAVERYTNMDVTRVVDVDDNYVVSFDLMVESDIVQGVYSCTTPISLEGMLDYYPASGIVECGDSPGSKMRLEAAAADTVDVSVDPEGDGTFVNANGLAEGSGTWADYIVGDLVATLVSLPTVDRSQIIPTISSRSLTISVNDAIYDPLSDTIFVSNDVGVVEVDPATLQTGRSVALAGRPGPVAVSDDGITLWVGLQEQSAIVPIDTAAMSDGVAVSLGVSQAPVGSRLAADIEVAPGTTGTVVASMQNGYEIVAYENGAELPGIILDSSAANDIVFKDASTIIGIEDQSSGFAASLIVLDENGLTQEKSLPRFSFGFGAELALGNEFAFVSSGRVLDVETENVIGRIDFAGFSSFRDGVYVDKAAGIAYFYDESSGIIDFYDEQRLVMLGRYRMNTNGTLLHILETATGDLLFVQDSGLHLVDKDLLQPTNLRERCQTVDLSGQLGPTFFIQIGCGFNSAIYDKARNLIYATLPSSSGPSGNSVAIIDPRTGLIQTTVFVGSEPTLMSLSASGNSLSVVLSESTNVARLDLQSQTLASPLHIPMPPLATGPGFPTIVAASPVLESELLVAEESSIDIFSAGMPSANGRLSAYDIEALFYRGNGQMAWAVELGHKFWEYAVDPVGLTVLREVRDAVLSVGLKMHDDLLYTIRGDVVDPDTLATVNTCSVTAGAAVEIGDDGGIAYYWLPGLQSKIVACDLTNYTLSDEFDIPNFGGTSADVRSLTLAGPDRLFLAVLDKMIILDPTEFN
jgi:hypothetical protein